VNDFELIPTVKMETRNHVEGSFGNEFSSTYNKEFFIFSNTKYVETGFYKIKEYTHKKKKQVT